jgi:hypothetical protein
MNHHVSMINSGDIVIAHPSRPNETWWLIDKDKPAQNNAELVYGDPPRDWVVQPNRPCRTWWDAATVRSQGAHIVRAEDVTDEMHAAIARWQLAGLR